MNMSSRGKTLVLLLSLALTSVGIEIAHADSYVWNTVSTIPSTGNYSSGISSDGSTIIVGNTSAGVYLSTDSGTTFSRVSTSSVPAARYYVAISGDGQKMFAANNTTHVIYYSTDGGVNWSSKAGVTTNITSTCMSANGNVWMVGGYSYGSFTSTDNGSTWTSNGIGSDSWYSCALSDDGTKRYMLPYNGTLKISTNSGTSYSNTTTTITFANCVSTSSDGSRVLVVSRVGSSAYLSTDSGSTFTQVYLGPVYLYGCSMSSNGQKLVIAGLNGNIVYSSDYGATWNAETTPTTGSWANISMSRDSSKIIALKTTSTAVYLGSFPLPSSISLTSGGNAVIVYRVENIITATANTAGKVTFYANGKKIGSCISIPTVSLVATCKYKPSIHGAVTISARLVPANLTYGPVTTELFRPSIITRTTKR